MITHHRQLRDLCFAPRVYFDGVVALTDDFVLRLAAIKATAIYLPRALLNRVRLAQLPEFTWLPDASGADIAGRGFYGEIVAGEARIPVFSDAFDSVPPGITLDETCFYVLFDKGDVTAFKELSFTGDRWEPVAGFKRGVLSIKGCASYQSVNSV